MSEPNPSRARLEERTEAVAELDRRHVADDRLEQPLVERRAEHGSTPEIRPVGRRKPVDLRSDQAADGVRQLLYAAEPLRRRDELPQEEWIALRAVGKHLELVRWERRLGGCVLEHLERVRTLQRLQLE